MSKVTPTARQSAVAAGTVGLAAIGAVVGAVPAHAADGLAGGLPVSTNALGAAKGLLANGMALKSIPVVGAMLQSTLPAGQNLPLIGGLASGSLQQRSRIPGAVSATSPAVAGAPGAATAPAATTSPAVVPSGQMAQASQAIQMAQNAAAVSAQAARTAPPASTSPLDSLPVVGSSLGGLTNLGGLTSGGLLGSLPVGGLTGGLSHLGG